MINLLWIIPLLIILFIYLMALANISARMQELEKKAARVEKELF